MGPWDYLLAGRPLLPLAVVWLTTAGHTMNFREMGIGKGWVAADVYSLHSVYLVSIALVLLASRLWASNSPSAPPDPRRG